MSEAILGMLVGFASGLLSGQFGIGGGLLTTPAIRLLLGQPALVAVGTPLPVIVPTAIVGAVSYARANLADVRGGLVVGSVGALASVPAALLTTVVGGSVVLILTAVLIAYMAVDMLLITLRPPRREASGQEPASQGAAEAAIEMPEEALEAPEGEVSAPAPPAPAPLSRLALLGLVAGLYSGFLGLGGGFVLVPGLTRWFGYPIKRAIGTSLAAISIMAVPGSIAHYLLGNVDLALVLTLVAGVVPGALLGARLTRVAHERVVQGGFSALLFVAAAVLVLSETGVL